MAAAEETNITGFFKRLMFKLSGMKVVGFIISGTGILVLVVMSRVFHGVVSDQIVLSAMASLEKLALGLFVANGAITVASVLKGGGNSNNSGS